MTTDTKKPATKPKDFKAEDKDAKKDALMQDLDEMFSEQPSESESEPKENEAPFLNCKDFELVSVSLGKNRVYEVLGIADGTNVKRKISQATALVPTQLEISFKKVSEALSLKVFPKNGAAVVKSFSRKTKQDKSKNSVTTMTVSADDHSGISTVNLKTTDADVNHLGEDFTVMYGELQDEVLHLLKENHSQTYVQPSLLVEGKADVEKHAKEKKSDKKRMEVAGDLEAHKAKKEKKAKEKDLDIKGNVAAEMMLDEEPQA